MTGMTADILALEFPRINLADFKRMYAGNIRVSADLDKIKACKVESFLLDPEHELYAPWYSKGNWRDGRPQRLMQGTRPALVRIPAVKHRGKYLALDGCHRITTMKPAIILVDALVITENQAVYFTDLFNAFWAKPQIVEIGKGKKK